MKVLFLDPIGELGGAERCLLDVMSVLKDEPGLEMRLLAFAPGPLIEEAEKIGVQSQVVAIPDSWMRMGDYGLRGMGRVPAAGQLVARAVLNSAELAGYVKTLTAAVNAVGPDVIHSNGIKTHLLSAMVRPRHAKLIWHIRDFLSERPFSGRMLQALAWRAHRALAISDAVAADAKPFVGGTKVQRIYDGVDVETFLPGSIDPRVLDALAGRPAASDGTLRVGMVAAYARWKGQDLFLRAAAEVAQRAKDVKARFYIVGGPLYATPGSQFSQVELEELARELGIAEQVAFVPFQESPADVYRALDIVVHASTRPEPFGRTVVEPMACGRAVVAPNAGGTAEIFRNGVDAIGYEMNDASSLALAIEKLARDSDYRRRLEVQARATAAERFDRKRSAREILTSYQRLRP